MALNTIRGALGRAGLRAFRHDTPFKPEADAALLRFQALREDLETQVRRGDLTVRVARERAAAAAAQLKAELGSRAEGYSPVPRVFLDRLIEAADARKRSREHASADGLQRETNRLLRLTLVEQQLQNRAREFEGKTAVRPLSGGQAAPTLESLLDFHEAARMAGDEAAAEWGRRQLEGIRALVSDPAGLRRIDLACDRTETVNPRLVASYMEALRTDGGDISAMESFVASALESRDANACVAAFLLAREAPGGSSVGWVRKVLTGLNEFPDSALETLRSVEAEARGADAEAARAQVDYAAAIAETQARLAGLQAPTDDELARRQRVEAKPVARIGEPIGLALDRRGYRPDEFEKAAGEGETAG